MTDDPTPAEKAVREADVADDVPTRRFHERVDAYRRDVERWRFAGESPVVRPGGRGKLVFEAAVAAVAAQRLRGLVELDGEAISPGEDLAAEELTEGLRGLATWSFWTAGRHLAAAADLARLPRLQQQVTLARALAQLCRTVVFGQPDGRGTVSDRDVRALVESLDLIPTDEAAFYGDEARRLVETWTAAASDEVLRAGWGLARARAAGRDDGRETELAWLLRLYRRHATRLAGDDYLAAVVRRAEALFRLLLPDVDEDARPDLEALAADAWPGELRPALVAALGTALDADLLAVSSRFALRIYRSVAVAGARA